MKGLLQYNLLINNKGYKHDSQNKQYEISNI